MPPDPTPDRPLPDSPETDGDDGSDDAASLELRRSLGRFATGVTVVTCLDARGRPCGITVNSFSSVSLEPPLVLWNIAKVSNSLEAFLNADAFVVNVLAEHQHELATHFARSDHTLFDEVDYDSCPEGVPVLPDTLAVLECRRQQVHDAGDHFIIIGSVERHRSDEGDPLLFFGGRYTAVAKPT